MPEIGNDWIGMENQKELGLQAWRFFQSGLITAETGFLDDWEDKLPRPLREDWVPGVRLSILDVVFRLAEVFGFASRLAPTDVYRDERSLVIDLTLYHVRDRELHDRGALTVDFLFLDTLRQRNLFPIPSRWQKKTSSLDRKNWPSLRRNISLSVLDGTHQTSCSQVSSPNSEFTR